MGRHAAGEGFLNAMARHAAAEELVAVAPTKAHFDDFEARVGKASGGKRSTRWIPTTRVEALAMPKLCRAICFAALDVNRGGSDSRVRITEIRGFVLGSATDVHSLIEN